MRICVVMEYHPDDLIGGSETQVFGLARQFALAGHEVTYICQRYDRTRPAAEVIDGVRVLRTLRWQRLFRFLAGPRLFWTVRASRPEVVYQRFASPYSGLAALTAMICKVPFVWGCAEDGSLDREVVFRGSGKLSGGVRQRTKQVLLRLDARICRGLFHFGVRHADAIVVQNTCQQELLGKHFGRSGKLIPNGVRLPPQAPERMSPEPLVLWLNRIAPRKNAEAFIRLAASLEGTHPHARFVLVGGRQNDQYLEEVRRLASAVPNLRMVGSVPPSEVQSWFDQAWVFVLTSTNEGFPNVLLQAWATGIPVVSLEVDPDHVMAREGLGLVPGTEEGLERDVSRLLSDASVREKLGNTARAYVDEHFEFAKVAGQYLSLFDRLVNQRAS